jgi:hypothetical protein
VVNVVRKYFGSSARQLPIFHPSKPSRRTIVKIALGYPKKILGLTLGYPKNLFWDYTTRCRHSSGDIPEQIARYRDYAFLNIFFTTHLFVVRNNLAFLTADT